MDTAEEAADYDAMDHGDVNRRFCDDVLAQGIIGPAVLDLGTGTALIAIELCRLAPNVRIVAVDLAEHMLAVAERNIERADLHGRILLEKGDCKALAYEPSSFATTLSNSLVHHIPEPLAVLSEMNRVTAPGGLVFVRDLVRPDSEAEVERLVELHAAGASEMQRALLRASLHAALTLDEIRELAAAAGMKGAVVQQTSDRHWTLSYRKS